jgi:hypothetical protein
MLAIALEPSHGEQRRGLLRLHRQQAAVLVGPPCSRALLPAPVLTIARTRSPLPNTHRFGVQLDRGLLPGRALATSGDGDGGLVAGRLLGRLSPGRLGLADDI